MDADANADVGGSTIALHERCSGELKMVLAAPRTQNYRLELGLVNAVSGLGDWVWYHVKCLGHDTSVRQHYKSEH